MNTIQPPVLDRQTEEKTRLTPRVRILILNDPVTRGDFVVGVLLKVFVKELTEAIKIMEEAHKTGVALVEVTERERAEFLVDQARSLARCAKYPLAFAIEPEE